MNIGIIGAGNIGGALTRRLTSLGHQVTVANSRGPETLAELTAETGAIAGTPEDAVLGADLVIITIQQKRIPELPDGLFDGVASNVPVIDTGNYYPQQRDGRIAAIEEGLTESRWVEQQIGHAVIKVFNNIGVPSLMTGGKPAGTPGRIALPIAGDNPVAKAAVMRLVDELGFDPVDAGTIDDSWRQQPGTPVYGRDYDAEGVRAALEKTRPGRRPEFTA
ncbi:MAG: NADPH-dependent F420 reductase [Tepidiformaceae bacterium]